MLLTPGTWDPGLGKRERVVILNPRDSSAESSLGAGRGLLSDSPLCFGRKFFSPPLEGLRQSLEIPQRAGRRGGHRKTFPLNLERSVMQTFKSRKGEWIWSPLESLCESRAKCRPAQKAELSPRRKGRCSHLIRRSLCLNPQSLSASLRRVSSAWSN